jgi:uncharacterized OsmC-like protein
MSVQAPVVEGEIVTIQTHATDVIGRFVVSAGRNHWVSDSRPAAGGPGEAVQAGQLLLASLASCGLGLIQSRAAELGVALVSSDVEAAFQRDMQDKTRYQWIRLVFTLGGVDAATAATLLAHFTDTCPIFNTLRRGGTVVAEVRTTA